MAIKKRIAIFCLFNPKGLINNSDIYILSELRKISKKIIVVVNGELKNLDIIKEDMIEVVSRDNKGYDAAAYKFILDQDVYRKKIQQYDELILCNNTFFGPFISFENIFNEMENKPCDFWGISSSKNNMVEHIQSYFIVLRKSILKETFLFSYFENYIKDDLNYEDVCRIFENGLFAWLIKHRYKYSAYVDGIKCNNYTNCYGSLVCDRLPIMKRKVFSDTYYEKDNCLSSLKYIKDTYVIDLLPILFDIEQLYDKKIKIDDIEAQFLEKPHIDMFDLDYALNRKDLLSFLEKYEHVYIWGTGNNARYIYNTLFYPPNSDKLLGFIVSDDIYEKEFCGHKVYVYGTMSNEKKVIILAVSEENTNFLVPYISETDIVLRIW